MSINLTLSDNKEKFKLWQTPTHITYMCLTPRNDKNSNILERYLFWVDSCRNDIRTDEEYQHMVERIQEHARAIKLWLQEHPNATFSWI